ncbi:unnamed protein product [Spirodela intermedia]|uniref:Uncharacterized protein n=2 Tax=Spirodela intermedia TaxID=51605 RepID=A0A7I8KE37_SPIIN|nr:unnamed protein product [Spirodela intermedia]CAA7395913.1 unnamed protein product [Spirodela intermedia]
MNFKVCNIIIDSGSSENIVSSMMVKKIDLNTSLHPHPYQICWIKKEIKTKSHQCLIKFSIDNTYFDEVQCDVVEMDACHIKLGRPW